jgi:hypothetical protein
MIENVIGLHQRDGIIWPELRKARRELGQSRSMEAAPCERGLLAVDLTSMIGERRVYEVARPLVSIGNLARPARPTIGTVACCRVGCGSGSPCF